MNGYIFLQYRMAVRETHRISITLVVKVRSQLSIRRGTALHQSCENYIPLVYWKA